MIRDIFLPTSINQYYLFEEKIVAFDIGYDVVRATLVSAHRRRRTIVAVAEERFVPGRPESFAEALTQLQKKLGKWSFVVVSLPSSKAIFKRLMTPFSSPKKIRLVLPFELESGLPFSADEAVFDCVLTGKKVETGETEVFAVALKKDVLASYLQPFIDAGIQPDRITLGSIELYGFMHELYPQDIAQNTTVIIESEERSTTVMLLVNGTLRSVRVLADGLEERFTRLDAMNLNDADKAYFDRLMRDIFFTIQASLKNEHIVEQPSQIFFVGAAVRMIGMVQAAEERLKIPCVLIHPHQVLKKDHVSFEGQMVIAAEMTESIAAALPSDITRRFNLGALFQEERALHRFKIQLVALGGLLGTLLIAFILYSFFTTRALRAKVERYKKEMVVQLEKEFKLPAGGKQPAQLLVTTEQKLMVEESVWSALTTGRYAFLSYMQEMFTRMNREKWGLELRTLSIRRDDQGRETTVSLEGSVRDFPALSEFATALQETKLFVAVPALQDTKFSMSLVIDKTGGKRG